MRKNRKWSALRLKKQYVYAQFDDCKPMRYKAFATVRDYLDEWEHPRWYKPRCKYWAYNSWKKHRKTQYKVKNQ